MADYETPGHDTPAMRKMFPLRFKTPERKAELAKKRAMTRAIYDAWADQIDRSVAQGINVDDYDEGIARRNREERFMVLVAAELMRQSTITEIKRAATAVRKREKQ